MAVTSFCSADYYRSRERAERTLADQAASPAIRDIHLEMAERYREHAEQLEMPARFKSIASIADISVIGIRPDAVAGHRDG